MIRLCSCGFGTDGADWLDGHLDDHPGHYERLPVHPVLAAHAYRTGVVVLDRTCGRSVTLRCRARTSLGRGQ